MIVAGVDNDLIPLLIPYILCLQQALQLALFI